MVKNKSLVHVNISGNDLSHLGSGAFDDVVIWSADFSNCNLKYFNPQRVDGKSLSRSNFSGNKLSHLGIEEFYDVNIYETNLQSTGAHIDLMRVNSNTKIGNLKGCSIINFEESLNKRDRTRYIVNQITYSEDSFDEGFISKHKEYFLDKNAPPELKEKFYSRTLDFETFDKYYEFLKEKKCKLFFEFEIENQKVFDFFNYEELKNVLKNRIQEIEYFLLLDKAEEMYLWHKNHKFIPKEILMDNFPKDQIHKFKGKRWSAFMKNEEFSKDENAKLGLLKAAMVLGAFEEDEQGYTKLLQMLNQEYNVLDPEKVERYKAANSEKNKDNKAPDSNENKKNKAEDSKQSKKYKILNASNVHDIFDSMSMTYDEDFKNLFMENFERVLKDSQFASKMSSIQRNFADIKAEPKGKKVTLEMCEYHLENLVYDNVKDGCHELAAYAKNLGYSQKEFYILQEAFLIGKQRESSSISEIKVQAGRLKGRILRLDDPLTLFVGKLTVCCQELGRAGESAMFHSMLEKNGRVFVVEDEEGRIVAQSWVWRNGNVLCFDNIEVPYRALGYKEEILEIYNKATYQFVRKDRETFEMLVKEGKVSKQEAEELKLAKVTVGKGYTDIDLDKFQEDSHRIRPQEHNKFYNKQKLYISDSQEQYILYKAENYRKSDEKLKVEDLNLYKDGRDRAKEMKGDKIHKDIIKLMKKIESEAFSKEEQVLQSTRSYSDVAKVCNCDNNSIRVVYNNDWYMVYEEKDKIAHIGDMASIKATDSYENKLIEKEQEQALYNTLNKYKKAFADVRSSEAYSLVNNLKDMGQIKILLDEALRDFSGNGEKRRELIIAKNETTKNVGDSFERY